MKKLWSQEEAQDLIEYVLVVTMLALAAAAAFPPLASALATAFNTGSTCLNSVTGC
jgi:hypothetical protein